MKKYFAFTKLSFQRELFYRADFFFYFLRQSLVFLVQILLFGVIFREETMIVGYNYSQFVQYFLIIYLVNLMIVTGVDSYLGEMIKNGDLSKHLMRPISFFWAIFFHQWGKQIHRLIYVGLVIVLFVFLGSVKISLWKITLFVLILANATILSFLYRFLLGISAFWLVNISSVLWLFRQSASFLGGGHLPLSFFPEWVGRLIRSLPFYLTLGFPAEFFQDKISLKLVFWNILQQFGWVLLLFWLVAILWSKGVKEYEAIGN